VVLWLALQLLGASAAADLSGMVSSGWRKRSYQGVQNRRARLAPDGVPYYAKHSPCNHYKEAISVGNELHTKPRLQQNLDKDPGSCASGGRHVSAAVGIVDSWEELADMNTQSYKKPPRSSFRSFIWADAVEDAEDCGSLFDCLAPPLASPLVDPDVTKAIDTESVCSTPLVEPDVLNNKDQQALGGSSAPSVLNPEAKEFSMPDGAGASCTDVWWLYETIEYQKQHIAFLLGQVSALSQVVLVCHLKVHADSDNGANVSNDGVGAGGTKVFTGCANETNVSTGSVRTGGTKVLAGCAKGANVASGGVAAAARLGCSIHGAAHGTKVFTGCANGAFVSAGSCCDGVSISLADAVGVSSSCFAATVAQDLLSEVIAEALPTTIKASLGQVMVSSDREDAMSFFSRFGASSEDGATHSEDGASHSDDLDYVLQSLVPGGSAAHSDDLDYVLQSPEKLVEPDEAAVALTTSVFLQPDELSVAPVLNEHVVVPDGGFVESLAVVEPDGGFDASLADKFIELQYLNQFALNGELGYVLGRADGKRCAVVIGNTGKRISVHVHKLRFLDAAEIKEYTILGAITPQFMSRVEAEIAKFAAEHSSPGGRCDGHGQKELHFNSDFNSKIRGSFNTSTSRVSSSLCE